MDTVSASAVEPSAYTIDAFGDAHGVKKTFTYAEIKAGRLIAHKAGKRTLILRENAAAWRANLKKIEPRK